VSLFFVRPSQAALTPLEIYAQEEIKSKASSQKTWFNNFNESRENFAEKYGTRFAFLFNYTQQAILKSSNDNGKSGACWYWNLEIEQNLWQGAALFAEFEVDRGKGVDKFLPTFSFFNDNSDVDANLYLPALYIEQNLISDKLLMAAGKLDLSYWFDYNDVANSADTQFFSSALVNSVTLPFPSNGIGAMAAFKPYEWMYFQAGAATAKAEDTKVGLSDAFNSVFFINELGFSPKLFGALKGNYRFILNVNHEKLDYIYSDENETKKNDLSWALSFDQAVTENITLFLRYGQADPKVRDIEYSWSCGGQITEPIPGRKFDCLGVGVAQSIMGKDYREANEGSTSSETMYEVYYSYSLNPVITLTPNIQIVANPNADKTADTEFVCGLRFLLDF
jgi:carbohydrate-selective porin OprB